MNKIQNWSKGYSTKEHVSFVKKGGGTVVKVTKGTDYFGDPTYFTKGKWHVVYGREVPAYGYPKKIYNYKEGLLKKFSNKSSALRYAKKFIAGL